MTSNNYPSRAQDNCSHNLNITSYSFMELLGLFDITTIDISSEQLKMAKKKVLMTHPDKSKLPSEYFLFYKKAFEIIANYYNNNNKINHQITHENTTYSTAPPLRHEQVTKAIEKLSNKEFHAKFNEIFEKNMASKPNPEKNEWFYKPNSQFDIKEPVNHKNMGVIIENIKEQNRGIVKYRGVETMYSNTGGASSSYSIGFGGDVDEEDDSYVNCDIFSKLKYDDLRKVHKEQTVFLVSEKDYDGSKYSSIDNYNKQRENSSLLKPVSNPEKMLLEQEKIFKEKMAKKHYESEIHTQINHQKSQSALSSYLRLTNNML